MKELNIFHLGLILVALSGGCPMNWAKGVGFNDRAMRKDMRLNLVNDGCPSGTHWILPGECTDPENCPDTCVSDIVCPRGQHQSVKKSCARERPEECTLECAGTP